MIDDFSYLVVGRFKGLQGQNWLNIHVNGLSSLVCPTRDSYLSLQIEISQTFVPYVWIVMVSLTLIFLSN